MVGVVLRRYFGQMAQRRMQVHWFAQVTDRYLGVPLRWFDDRPAGELLAHADADCERSTMAMQPLPFSLGVVVIIVVSMVQLAFVDPVLGVGLALFPSLALLNNAYTRRVEKPAALAQARVGDVSAVATRASRACSSSRPSASSAGRWPAPAAAESSAKLAGHGQAPGRLAGTRPGCPPKPRQGGAALWLGAWRVSTARPHDASSIPAMAPVRHPRLPVPGGGLPPRGAAPRRRGPRSCQRGRSPRPSASGRPTRGPPRRVRSTW